MYLACIIVVGILFFWYAVNSWINAGSLIALGIFAVLAVAGMIMIRSNANVSDIQKDRPVTDMELAEFKENPKVWIYLRFMVGLFGMAVGAGAAFLLFLFHRDRNPGGGAWPG